MSGPTTALLPNLLIAGAPKAGTTSLFWYLAQHPEVCASKVKELGYFLPLREPGGTLPPPEAYAEHFDHCGGQPYRMEGSPLYAMAGAPIIEGIRATLERPRIVISLRDPVTRFWSGYTFARSKGNIPEVRSADEFISICESAWHHGTEDRPGARRPQLALGRYAEYLPAWFDAFGDDVRIVFAEDLFRDPTAVLTELATWLGIDPQAAAEIDTAPRNRTVEPRNERLARLAYDLKEHSDRWLEDHPALRDTLRRLYRRVNTTEVSEELTEATRARLERLYARPNRDTARLLREHGYERLPAWLADDRTS